METKRFALALVTIAALAGACGGSSDPADDAGGNSREAATTQAEITAFRYQPNPLEIELGTTVTWTNNDDIDHTVTSGKQEGDSVPGVSEGSPAEPDGAFRGVLSSKGTTFEFTFTEAGEFPYFCEIHAGMTGIVIVR